VTGVQTCALPISDQLLHCVVQLIVVPAAIEVARAFSTAFAFVREPIATDPRKQLL